MNAQPLPVAAPTSDSGIGMILVLRGLLLLEAALGLVVTIALSLAASEARDALGTDTEVSLRFAAAAAFLFAIFAAVASRGARRRRRWSWTMAAFLQVILAVGTGVAVIVGEWHPVYLVGFGLATLVMLVLSAGSVRRALGQG